MKKQGTISASEITAFLYCQRSWWYRLHGEENTNFELMERAAIIHDELAEEIVQAAAEKQQLKQREKGGQKLIWVALLLVIIFVLVRLLSSGGI